MTRVLPRTATWHHNLCPDQPPGAPFTEQAMTRMGLLELSSAQPARLYAAAMVTDHPGLSSRTITILKRRGRAGCRSLQERRRVAEPKPNTAAWPQPERHVMSGCRPGPLLCFVSWGLDESRLTSHYTWPVGFLCRHRQVLHHSVQATSEPDACSKEAPGSPLTLSS